MLGQVGAETGVTPRFPRHARNYDLSAILQGMISLSSDQSFQDFKMLQWDAPRPGLRLSTQARGKPFRSIIKRGEETQWSLHANCGGVTRGRISRSMPSCWRSSW